MIIPWQIPILAVANRARDGWITEILPPANPIAIFFTKYSQMGRLLLWALPFAVSIFLTLHPHHFWVSVGYFAALWVFAFLGSCWATWGKYDGDPVDWLSLAVEGVKFVLPTALVLVAYGHILTAAFVFLGGWFVSPAYSLGWKLPGKWHGTLFGSLFFGALIGLGLFL